MLFFTMLHNCESYLNLKTVKFYDAKNEEYNLCNI